MEIIVCPAQNDVMVLRRREWHAFVPARLNHRCWGCRCSDPDADLPQTDEANLKNTGITVDDILRDLEVIMILVDSGEGCIVNHGAEEEIQELHVNGDTSSEVPVMWSNTATEVHRRNNEGLESGEFKLEEYNFRMSHPTPMDRQAHEKIQDYDGPPCGVGIVLRSSSRDLQGTFRRHRRWSYLLPTWASAHARYTGWLKLSPSFREVQRTKCWGQGAKSDVPLALCFSPTEARQVATAVANRLESAKSLIVGPPGSIVVLKMTRGQNIKDYMQSSFDVALRRELLMPVPQEAEDRSSAREDKQISNLRLADPREKLETINGLAFSNLSDREVQKLFCGPQDSYVEVPAPIWCVCSDELEQVTIKKADGTVRRVNIKQQTQACSVNSIKELLLSSSTPPVRPKQQISPAPQQPTLLGSRTLARFNSALVQNWTSSRSKLMGSMSERVSGLWSSFSDQHTTEEEGSKDQEKPATQTDEKPPPPPVPPSHQEGEKHEEKGCEDRELSRDSHHHHREGRKEDESTAEGHVGDPDVQPLRDFLKKHHLDFLLPRLVNELGVTCLEDVYEFVDENLVMLSCTVECVSQLQLPPVQHKKFCQLISADKSEKKQEVHETEKAAQEASEKKSASEHKHKSSSRLLAQKILMQREERKQLEQQREKERKDQELKALQEKLEDSPQTPDTEKNVRPNMASVGSCVALFDYNAQAKHEMSIKANEVISVLRKHPSGWWEGCSSTGVSGWFPSTFVKEVGHDSKGLELATVADSREEVAETKNEQVQIVEAEIQEQEEAAAETNIDGGEAEQNAEIAEEDEDASMQADAGE
eukprot:754421-Hanusia_phi.AAC.2